MPKDIRLNDDAKAAVKLAEEIASYSDAFYVQPEHVFAAMLRQKDGLVVEFLRLADIDLANAEAIALRVKSAACSNTGGQNLMRSSIRIGWLSTGYRLNTNPSEAN
ncbi:MAG TPA: Clp protease N-terminal domain-containing protein [Oculatellaceae cyanobacterium]